MARVVHPVFLNMIAKHFDAVYNLILCTLGITSDWSHSQTQGYKGLMTHDADQLADKGQFPVPST